MQINQFIVSFNYENIMDEFDVYESSNINYKSYAKYFNQLKDEVKEALSIIYLRGKVYILTKKGFILNGTELDIKKQMIHNLGWSKEFILFKLLVHANIAIKDKKVIFDSDGLFYIVKPSKRVYETVLVNIKESRDKQIYFTLNAKNFIAKKHNKNKKERRDKYRDNRGVLIRIKKEEEPKQYFVKQKDFDGYKRSHVDFLQTDWTKRQVTKIDVLIRFLKDIRSNLKQYFDVGLKEIDFEEFKLEGSSIKRNEEIMNLIKIKLSKGSLVIEDSVKDNRSQKFINEVKQIIEEDYGSTLTLEKIRNSKSSFNLLITESKESENDPYSEIKKLPKATQNILLKNLDTTKTILPVLLKELIVKQDILNRKISIPHYQEVNKLTFYYFKTNKEPYEIYKMILDKNSIDLQKIENRVSLFEEDEKGYIQKIFFEAEQNNSEAELIIKNEYGDVNIITKTNYFPIPNIEDVANEYDELSKPFYKSYSELLSLSDDVPNDRREEYMIFLKSVENREKINLRVEVKNRKVKNYIAKKCNINLDKNLSRSRNTNTPLDVLTGVKYR